MVKTVLKLSYWLKAHKIHILVLLVGLSLFSLLVILAGRVAGTDDSIFQKLVTQYPTVFDWVSERYATWSGRIFSEGFVYIFNIIPLFIYKIVSILMYLLFIFSFYMYYRLFSVKRSREKDILMLACAALMPYLLSISVFAPGVLWVTGSMNYFWIATIGSIGLYPTIKLVVNRADVSWKKITFGILLSMVAITSQEQVGAVMVGLSLIFLVHILNDFRRKNSVYQVSGLWKILVTCIGYLTAFIISIRAPGNALRLKSEINYWQPDFNSVPLMHRIEYDYRWVLEAFVNHSGFILIGIWLAMLFLIIRKKRHDFVDLLTTFVIGAATIILLAKGHKSVGYWTTFYAQWNTPLPSKSLYLILGVWGIVIFVTILMPIVVYRRQIKGYMVSLLLSAALASTALMCFSPTMYASGWRTLYVPSFILCIVLYILIESVFDTLGKSKIYIIWVIALLASSQYLLLLHGLIKGDWLTF